MTQDLPEIAHPWVDESEAPLYVLGYPPKATDEEVAVRHQEIATWYKKVNHPIAWVVDCANVIKAPATQRKIIAEHEKSIRPYSERFNVGVALVVGNSMVTGLLTAIYWLAPPPYAYKIFSEFELAKAWARERLVETDDLSRTRR